MSAVIWDWICPLCKTEWTGARNLHACKGLKPVGGAR